MPNLYESGEEKDKNVNQIEEETQETQLPLNQIPSAVEQEIEPKNSEMTLNFSQLANLNNQITSLCQFSDTLLVACQYQIGLYKKHENSFEFMRIVTTTQGEVRCLAYHEAMNFLLCSGLEQTIKIYNINLNYQLINQIISKVSHKIIILDTYKKYDLVIFAFGKSLKLVQFIVIKEQENKIKLSNIASINQEDEITSCCLISNNQVTENYDIISVGEISGKVSFIKITKERKTETLTFFQPFNSAISFQEYSKQCSLLVIACNEKAEIKCYDVLAEYSLKYRIGLNQGQLGGMKVFQNYLILTSYTEKKRIFVKKLNLNNFEEIILLEGIGKGNAQKEMNLPGPVYQTNDEELYFAIGSRLFQLQDLNNQ